MFTFEVLYFDLLQGLVERMTIVEIARPRLGASYQTFFELHYDRHLQARFTGGSGLCTRLCIPHY